MKILIIGASGNMGGRYAAICKYLGHDVIESDIAARWFDPKKTEFDKAIIATPTKFHGNDIKEVIDAGKPFLCEKPISFHIEEVQQLAEICKSEKIDGRMVCNWAMTNAEPLKPLENRISYDFFHTGKDGLAWDIIQLIYLAKDLFVETKSPIFRVRINGWVVSLDDICRSYVKMINRWLVNPDLLWNMEDAVRATEKTLEYEKTLPARRPV